MRIQNPRNDAIFSPDDSRSLLLFSDVESGVESRSMTSSVLDIQATTTDLMRGSRRITTDTLPYPIRRRIFSPSTY